MEFHTDQIFYQRVFVELKQPMNLSLQTTEPQIKEITSSYKSISSTTQTSLQIIKSLSFGFKWHKNEIIVNFLLPFHSFSMECNLSNTLVLVLGVAQKKWIYLEFGE